MNSNLLTAFYYRIVPGQFPLVTATPQAVRINTATFYNVTLFLGRYFTEVLGRVFKIPYFLLKKERYFDKLYLGIGALNKHSFK